MGGMREFLTRARDLRSSLLAESRPRRRGIGRVAILASVLVLGAAAGIALAAAGRGSGGVWPYAVPGPVAAVAFGVSADRAAAREDPDLTCIPPAHRP